MKNKFKEYIQPTDEERKAIWENGVFVLDANVLLNMCRYSKKSSDELIAIIKTHENNLWLPYQVGMEFFNNRLGVIEGIRNGFEKLLENIGNIENVLIDNLKFKDFRSDTAHNIEQLKVDFKNFRNREEAKIRKWKKEFEESDKDAVLDEILALYDGKVGDDYDEAKLEDIYKEGAARYKDNIPPGYADWKNKEKDGRRHVFGDLIWWKQAIDYARDNKCNLVIVTDDKKEDWWYKVSGKTISPRVELIREFHRETGGQKFLMYRTHQFMEIARILDGANVSDASIQEVKTTGSTEYNAFVEYFSRPNDVTQQLFINPQTILGGGTKLTGQGVIPGVGYHGLQGTINPNSYQYLLGNDIPSNSIPSGGMTMTNMIDYMARHGEDFPASDLFIRDSSRNNLNELIEKRKKDKDNDVEEEMVEV